ncbi:hypothetical protein NMG60_11028738 [Bertholletia excelsa]
MGRLIVGLSVTTAPAKMIPTKATFSPPVTVQRSPWHSPVPYLFGGLAAMLGLVAFALLILACSYWKFCGRHGRNSSSYGQGDIEDAVEESADKANNLPVFQDKILVIMAGEMKPTFLATPLSTITTTTPSASASLLGINNNKQVKDQRTQVADEQKTKQEMAHHDQTAAPTSPLATTETGQIQQTQDIGENPEDSQGQNQ